MILNGENPNIVIPQYQNKCNIHNVQKKFSKKCNSKKLKETIQNKCIINLEDKD